VRPSKASRTASSSSPVRLERAGRDEAPESRPRCPGAAARTRLPRASPCVEDRRLMAPTAAKRAGNGGRMTASTKPSLTDQPRCSAPGGAAQWALIGDGRLGSSPTGFVLPELASGTPASMGLLLCDPFRIIAAALGHGPRALVSE
jgi:hypothetical protein